MIAGFPLFKDAVQIRLSSVWKAFYNSEVKINFEEKLL